MWWDIGGVSVLWNETPERTYCRALGGDRMQNLWRDAVITASRHMLLLPLS